MPEPTTALVLAGSVAQSAAEEFGSRAGEEIANLVFGDDEADDLERIQEKLKLMDQKLDQLLATTRATNVLVSLLPGVMARIIDERFRDEAWRSLKSGRDVLLSLNEWHGGVSLDYIYRAYEAWRTVLDLEDRMEELIKLPAFAQFLLAMTKGAALDLVRSSLIVKVSTIAASSLEAKKRLEEALLEAEGIIGTEYISSGSLLDAAPWITWTRAPDRSVRSRRWIEVGGMGFNGPPPGYYIDVEEPDTVWNTAASEKSARLAEIQSGLARLVSVLVTIEFAHAVLSKYLEALENYSAPVESIRTIPGSFPFPEEMVINE
ncbi:hypothetical protein GTA62_14730 [Roseobacter sp. HKCCD9010]|uniref:hypothetical protein n=1 Tax=unclassified Roseobacter TaxID=196798 RepID=UPI001493208B|nr:MULTISPECIES: hypothetical protein [unclassified Roseobacter]MBF9050634.1 hypothetical protein [Rhodobacterales bacterium HKCCD4356]NNV11948.1 hypothetical protein [Roseobacter sp. HKCCD7357]NNV16961.1 hypothetical protein [Roseobacter sp. HKCCD8768]NNV26190.1 hypothetical protein [Roseobacter sp. HKCCD8192]NNV30685.1 hypothetical protein [Roseobacter sp. HKCCD9061]